MNLNLQGSGGNLTRGIDLGLNGGGNNDSFLICNNTINNFGYGIQVNSDTGINSAGSGDDGEDHDGGADYEIVNNAVYYAGAGKGICFNTLHPSLTSQSSSLLEIVESNGCQVAEHSG